MPDINQSANTSMADEKIKRILADHDLKIDCEVHFPRYAEGKLPDEVVIAMKLLIAHGMKITFGLLPQK